MNNQLSLRDIRNKEIKKSEGIEFNTDWFEKLGKIAEGVQDFRMKLEENVAAEEIAYHIMHESRDIYTNALYIVSGTLDTNCYNKVANKIEDDVILNVISRQQIKNIDSNNFYNKIKKGRNVRYGHLDDNPVLHGIATLRTYGCDEEGYPEIINGFLLLENPHDSWTKGRDIYTTGRKEIIKGFIRYFEDLYQKAEEGFDGVVDYDIDIWRNSKAKSKISSLRQYKKLYI